MSVQHDKSRTRKMEASEEQTFVTRGNTTVPSLSFRVGQRIRKARRGLQLTQMHLAEPEFSTSYISSIERGKINPSLTALSILAQKLKLPVTHFLNAEQSDQEGLESLPGTNWDGQATISAAIALYQKNGAQVFELLTPTTLARMDAEERVKAYLALARAHLMQRDLLDAAVAAEQGLHEAQQLEDLEATLRAKALLADISYQQHKLTQALALYQDCLPFLLSDDDLAQSTAEATTMLLHDPPFAIEVINGAGRCAAAQGNHPLALKYYTQAQNFLLLSAKDDLLAAEFRKASASAHQNGHGATAARYAQQSRALYEVAHLRQQIAILLTSSGKALCELNQGKAAHERLQEAVTYARQIANREAEALAAAVLAELLVKENAPKEAKKWAQEAATAAAELGSYVRGLVAITMGQVAASSGSLAEARKHFQQAISLLEVVEASVELSHCYYLFGEILTQAGQMAEASNWFKKAYLVQQDPSAIGPDPY